MVLQAKNPVIALLLLVFLSVACNNRKSPVGTVSIDAKAIPMMHTENVSEVVSDSGITRYRLKAPVWDVYVDDVPEPYAFFPKGILIEQFDSVFNVDGSIRADTAYNYTNRKLWRAVGNVKAVNLKGEKFETSELFWDERSGSIYTDKFMRAERDGKIHAGTGFRSNQTMTHWRILKYNADLGTVAENDSTTSRNKDTTETGE